MLQTDRKLSRQGSIHRQGSLSLMINTAGRNLLPQPALSFFDRTKLRLHSFRVHILKIMETYFPKSDWKPKSGDIITWQQRANEIRVKLNKYYDSIASPSYQASMMSMSLSSESLPSAINNNNSNDNNSSNSSINDNEAAATKTAAAAVKMDEQTKKVFNDIRAFCIQVERCEKLEELKELGAKVDAYLGALLSGNLKEDQKSVAIELLMIFVGHCCITLITQMLDFYFDAYDELLSSLRYWESRSISRFWYVYEKTPYYWINYLAKSKFGTVPVLHPKDEPLVKLSSLRALELYLNTQVGRDMTILSIGSGVTSKEDLWHSMQFTLDTLIRHGEVRLRTYQRRGDSFKRSKDDETNFDELGEEDLKYERDSAASMAAPSIASFQDVFKKLSTCVDLSLKQVEKIQDTLEKTSKDSHFSRHWIEYTVGGIVATIVVSRAPEFIPKFVDLFEQTKGSAEKFYLTSIKEPLHGIWATIRYDKHSLQVVDRRALDESIESLAHMLEDFVKDTKKSAVLTPEEKEFCLAQAQTGELSAIMPLYEEAIRHPISSAVFGSLLRMMLIQVQKQKVDVERGMLALDQLLKSNELNFQLMATIPAILLGVTAYFSIYLLFTRKKTVQLFSDIHKKLLAIEKLLNKKNRHQGDSGITSSPDGNGIDSTSHITTKLSTIVRGLGYKNYGKLLLLINQLNLLVRNLPRENWKAFFADLLELASEKMQVHQRLGTLNRIYRSPYFLKLQR